MWKLCVALLSLIVLTEAKFNKYERLKEVFEYIKTNETLMQMFKEHERQHVQAVEEHMKTRALHPFECHNHYTPMTGFTPTTVHQLRPENINVIAAMGDSLTAGNGILGSSVLDCLTEYRGRAWSIGGDLNFDQGVETLPNIIRKFNHNLKGFSMAKCDTSNKGCSQLNVAVAGETSQEMPRQAQDLIARLKDSDFGVDYNNDWKLITLFIGGNDLCGYCHDRALYSPANYIAKIRDALDILHANVPKAFVNLVEIFDITPLGQVSHGKFFCNLVTNMVCDCAKQESLLPELSRVSKEYQVEIENLVASGRYDTRDDFTVVLQPFFKNTEPVRLASGEHDIRYFAPDCFHFSSLGTNAAGKSLWDNMLEPVGAKQTVWHLNSKFHCPPAGLTAGQGVFKTTKN